jgi:hypothetical protein
MASKKIAARTLDLTNVKDASGINPKHKESGEYLGKIVEVRDDPAKDGEAMWTWIIKTTDDSTATYPYYVKLIDSQLWKLRNLFIAAGIPLPKRAQKIDPNKVVGKEVGMYLDDDEYEGKMKSVISSVMPKEELAEYADGADEVDDDEDDEEEEEVAPVKRGRGRPKKVVEEEDDDDEEEEEPAPVKRGRGRPKKVVEPEEDDDDEDEEEDEPEPPKKRGRGRPRKVAEPEEDDDDDEEEAPAPKKRGRPAKAAAKSAPVKKRRRRADDDDDDLDIDL